MVEVTQLLHDLHHRRVIPLSLLRVVAARSLSSSLLPLTQYSKEGDWQRWRVAREVGRC
jgi:hypothetical protein